MANGLGYDDLADKLLRDTNNSGREVVTVSDVAGVSGDNPNPHLWYSPTCVTAAARAIADQLAKADAAAFQANVTAFLDGYQPYIDTLATIRAKYAGTFAYTERVPGYLLASAGPTPGTPPRSPSRSRTATTPPLPTPTRWTGPSPTGR